MLSRVNVWLFFRRLSSMFQGEETAHLIQNIITNEMRDTIKIIIIYIVYILEYVFAVTLELFLHCYRKVFFVFFKYIEIIIWTCYFICINIGKGSFCSMQMYFFTIQNFVKLNIFFNPCHAFRIYLFTYVHFLIDIYTEQEHIIQLEPKETQVIYHWTFYKW